MGLIGDNCGPCQDAANDPNGGGLAGSWWRGWDRVSGSALSMHQAERDLMTQANDLSGYIGAAIVGAFVCVVASSYGLRYAYRKYQVKRPRSITKPEATL
jgi:nickel/cobalt transporter (NiCoT) family protein